MTMIANIGYRPYVTQSKTRIEHGMHYTILLTNGSLFQTSAKMERVTEISANTPFAASVTCYSGGAL